MKARFFLLIMLTGLFACQNMNGPTVTMEGPQVDMLKTMVENYEKGDLDANLEFYSDTAKIYRQGWGLPSITPAEDMKNSKAALEAFSEYDISDEIYEVVTTEDGTHWLHFWGVWTGKLEADGSEVILPFFMNPAIKDGKIQLMSFYADNSIVIDAIQKATTPDPLAEEVESGEDASD